MDKLTVNYLSLLKLNTRDRLEEIRSGVGPSLLEALTPSQQAALFPSYFRQAPSSQAMMGAMSGGLGQAVDVPSGGSGSSSSYSPALPQPSGSSGSGTASEPQKTWRERMAEKQKAREAASSAKTATGRRIDRSKFADQMKDEETLQMFAARMKSEVGSQGREAKIAWAESTFNRAESRKLTLKQAVSGAYFPTSRPGRSDDQELIGIIKEVQANGTDTTNGATGNASGSVGFGYGKAKRDKDGNWHAPGQTATFGGERFGREKNDENWTPTYIEELDAAKESAKKNALPMEQQQVGNVFPDGGGLQPKQDAPTAPSAPLTELPQGVDPGIAEYYKGLQPEEQKKLLAEMTGLDVKDINQYWADDKKKSNIDLAKRSFTAGLQPKFKLPDGKSYTEALPADTERFYHAGGKLEGVDPKLVHLLKESSKDLPPGYRMEMISGKDARSTGTKNHPNGLAVDVKLYDDKGKALNHGSPGAGWGAYERMYQSVYQRGKMYYPDEEFIWGGAWHSAAAGMGDKMHYQRRVKGVGSQSSGDYDPNTGLKPNKYYLDPTGERLSPEQIAAHRAWVKARVEAQAEKRAREQELSKATSVEATGEVKPPPDNTFVPADNGLKPASERDSTPNPPSSPAAEIEARTQPTASPVDGPPKDNTAPEALGNSVIAKENGDLKAPTATSIVEPPKQNYDYSHGSNQAQVNADNIFPKEQTAKQVSPAPKSMDAPKVTKSPEEPAVPKMKSGGSVRASGEEFSIIDNNSKRKLGEVGREESINFRKSGNVEVTPDRRVDPRALEAKRETRQTKDEDTAKVRAQEQETHTNVVRQVQPQEPNARFAQTEQWGAHVTPASYMRAMAAAKGRKDMGSFAGSRFGEEQLSNLN